MYLLGEKRELGTVGKLIGRVKKNTWWYGSLSTLMVTSGLYKLIFDTVTDVHLRNNLSLLVTIPFSFALGVAFTGFVGYVAQGLNEYEKELREYEIETMLKNSKSTKRTGTINPYTNDDVDLLGT